MMVRSATAQDDVTLTLSRTYPVDRAAVFAAWTDPELMVKWFAPTPEHAIEVREYDFRVGGRYRLAFRKGNGPPRDVVVGEFTEVEAPARVAYTWNWSEPSDHANVDTLVTVEFHDHNGETELVLTHTRFSDDEMRGSHEQGWSGCLESLAAYLA